MSSRSSSPEQSARRGHTEGVIQQLLPMLNRGNKTSEVEGVVPHMEMPHTVLPSEKSFPVRTAHGHDDSGVQWRRNGCHGNAL